MRTIVWHVTADLFFRALWGLRGARMVQTYQYQLYEMTYAALAPARAISDAANLVFRNPWNPLANTALGRNISAGTELFERLTRRYRKPTFGFDRVEVDGVVLFRARGDRVEPAVLQSAALRSPGPARRGDAAQDADRRADVGPLRHLAARHRRGVSAGFRRLHHRLGGCARGSAGGRGLRSRRLHRLSARDAENVSDPASIRSASVSRPCRCWRRRP